MKFIKLTDYYDRNAVYVNVETITDFFRDADVTRIGIINRVNHLQVVESPELIIKMIEGLNGN